MRKETCCRHIGYSLRLTARVLLYAPSHRQDSTYHGLCYTSSGALAGTRNSSMGSPDEGSIRRPITSWANALTTELHLAPPVMKMKYGMGVFLVCFFLEIPVNFQIKKAVLGKHFHWITMAEHHTRFVESTADFHSQFDDHLNTIGDIHDLCQWLL